MYVLNPNTWFDVQQELAWNMNSKNSKKEVKDIFYEGEVLTEINKNNEQILICINNKYAYILSKYVKVKEKKIYMPEFLYNQHFK
jgi:hypothetical protein